MVDVCANPAAKLKKWIEPELSIALFSRSRGKLIQGGAVDTTLNPMRKGSSNVYFFRLHLRSTIDRE